MTSLHELIKSAPELNLSVYILKYLAITNVLVSKDSISLLRYNASS